MIYPYNVWHLIDARAMVETFVLASIDQPWNVTIPIEQTRHQVTFNPNAGLQLLQRTPVPQSGQYLPSGQQVTSGQQGFPSTSNISHSNPFYYQW
jgi:hypothetical protein